MWTNPRTSSPKMWSASNPPPQSSHRSSQSISNSISTSISQPQTQTPSQSQSQSQRQTQTQPLPLSPTIFSRTGTVIPTQKLKNQGKRIAQIVKLKPDCVEKYKDCHARVWPEVLKQIKECCIEDYSIYHDPSTNILFASFKYVGYDYVGDMERMRENPKVREWWSLTDSYQESLVEGSTGSTDERGWWKGVDEVFYVA
ncbi:DUF718 domain protein [Sclerotinia borealis F-4128]|uniref:DUF718 domain protein n=1 Tax=Sclerotinia borealis (strain F-4128) TaxID=1432307 RepID=W9C7R3_SCLBF|nr:DUF718 domain protein [Sclerotinia borealis F-4128]